MNMLMQCIHNAVGYINKHSASDPALKYVMGGALLLLITVILIALLAGYFSYEVLRMVFSVCVFIVLVPFRFTGWVSRLVSHSRTKTV